MAGAFFSTSHSTTSSRLFWQLGKTMNLRGKRILITGSEGFIGRHFDEELAEDNYIDRIDKVLGTTAQNFFNSPFGTKKYDLVIHCAAMVGGRAKIDGDPLAIA